MNAVARSARFQHLAGHLHAVGLRARYELHLAMLIQYHRARLTSKPVVRS